jgi:hypothetical protein
VRRSQRRPARTHRAAAEERGYRGHEFGDSLLIERGEEKA